MDLLRKIFLKIEVEKLYSEGGWKLIKETFI